MRKPSRKPKPKRTRKTGAKAAKKRKKVPRPRAPRKRRAPSPPAPPSAATRGAARGLPECLGAEEALDVIRTCLGGILPDLETPLRDLFPSADRRKQFCRCVGNAVAASFACEAGTTLQDIFDAISC